MVQVLVLVDGLQNVPIVIIDGDGLSLSTGAPGTETAGATATCWEATGGLGSCLTQCLV